MYSELIIIGCGKCPLYNNFEAEDMKAMREAGHRAAKEINASNIDIDQFLSSDTAKKQM
jgi:hypothetical protein